ncbi:MFS transporter [Actinocorallia sp. A-T 12471]|uniref:MFS transporter n=1 Tax=Actinocorallia sp. A-T 12471 TaxID=3089813 RepID=UPI0029CDA136|nr:MFS transporter [Actinocorallia sp. A-T 12471]MDX6741857.1 MFS transporter [Actinocorallia sp. A-T 12471]
MTKAPYRLARATAFAAVCVSLTLAGHWTASGDPVDPWALAAAFFGVTGVAHLLAGHERGLPLIMGALLGGQFALHSLLATDHHSPLSGPDGTMDGRMMAAHVTAALLSAVWLRRGERAFWALARRLVPPLRLIPVRVPAYDTTGTPAYAEPQARPKTTLLRHSLVLRGPPNAAFTR